MTASEASEGAELREALAQRAAESPDELLLAMTEVSALLLEDEGLESTLHRIADLAVRTIPGCTAAGVTLLSNGEFETAACSDPLVLEVDRRQYLVDDGPCLDAMRRRVVNRVDVQGASERWPEFAAQARECGIRSFLAAPLAVGNEAMGALNLYSSSADGFDALDDALVAMFCSQASVAVANARLYRSALGLIDHLRAAMASRAVIEQAKGILMAQEGASADEAFGRLRDISQQSNRKLREVAQELVERMP